MKKRWKRNIVVGLVVGLIFFGWFLRGFFWINWRFKLFSSKSWRFLFNEFKSGWMLSAISDWIFLLTLCSAIPCFLYLWYLCSKVHWRRLCKKILRWIKKVITWPINWMLGRSDSKTNPHDDAFTTKDPRTIGLPVAITNNTTNIMAETQTIPQNSLIVANSELIPVQPSNPNLKRPKPMATQHLVTAKGQAPAQFKTTFQTPGNQYGAAGYGGNMNYGTPMNNYGGALPPSTPAYHPMDNNPYNRGPLPDMENESYSANMGDVAQMPLDDIHLPERKAVVEDIEAILTERGYRALLNVALPSGILNYIAVSADTIWAILLDVEPSDWLADEESFNGEDPLWFSEIDHRISPVYTLQKMCSELSNVLGEARQNLEIKPLLIEQKGNIINAMDMMKTWFEAGVTVCRTDVGGSDDLTLFGDFLKPSEAVSEEVFLKISNALNRGE